MKILNKKFLSIFLYLVVLAILEIVFWTNPNECGLGFGIISYYILIPLSIFAISISYGISVKSKKKYFLILFLGISVMIFQYSTYSLANMLAFQKINMPSITTFLEYGVISLIGIVISNFRRKK